MQLARVASDTSDDAQRCPAVKRNGQPCGVRVTASGYCFAHGPDATANRAKGGAGTRTAARAAKLVPARLQPVADLIEQALHEAYSGELDTRRASAVASLAGVLVRIVTAGELEDRMRELERMARDQERRWNRGSW